MRNRINFLIVIIMILSLFGCKKTSKIEILGVYAVDKQPPDGADLHLKSACVF